MRARMAGGAGVALAVLVLGGCGTSGPSTQGTSTSGASTSGASTSGASTSGASTSGTVAGTTTPPAEAATGPSSEPATETSGTEQPQSSRPEDPVLSLPSLPIGGSPSNADDIDQCVGISWLRDTAIPPDGVSVSVADVTFDPEGTFTVGGPACEGNQQPRCLDDTFVFTAEHIASGNDRCLVPVHATGQGTQGDQVTMTFLGEFRCPSGAAARCRSYQGDVRGQAQTVSLQIPSPATPSESSSGSTDSATPSEPASATTS